MHINNPLKIKKISQEGIIYALIFVLYIVVAVIIFIYAINFLRPAINSTIVAPDGAALENYGELDLANYSLVANKLGLKKTNQIVQTPEITPAPIQIATSSLTTTATTSLPQTTIATVTPVISTPAIEKRPRIIITNSTTKSGLAADLKSKLTAAGYQIISTGNSQPSLATIKVKNSISPDSKYLAEIKKIVKASYDLVIVSLDEKASYDLEIVIGNK
jgi:hypothetical protein